jgi:DNA-binding transcriptional LysR family regulator
VIELRQLRHFMAVVELGNFSAAAERVFVSQSALTRSIQHLEQALGAPLLTRGARRTVPTAAGDRLFAYARMILRDCADAAAEVQVIQAGDTGEVELGFDSIFAFHYLDVALLSIAKQAPGLTVRALEEPAAALLQAVEEGRLDFALVRVGSRDAIGRQMSFESLLTIETVLVAGRGHPLARRRGVTAADLIGTKWMVLEDPLSLDVHEHFFAKHRIPPTRAVRTNSPTLILDQLAHGDFLSLLPEPLVRRRLRHRLLRLLDVDLPAGDVDQQAGFVLRRDTAPSAAAARIMNVIRRTCAAPEGAA